MTDNEKKLLQAKHRLEEAQARDRVKERKARTRRLIQEGAILEKVFPFILSMELDRHDFTEKRLNTAWNEMTNEDIVADIIAFVRQQAIGSVLISHETRVKNAFAKLRQNYKFNKVQLDWLKRIEKVMLEEAVLDEQMFEQGAFKNNGGFRGIDRRFEGQLHEVIMELNQYLYDDGGNVA